MKSVRYLIRWDNTAKNPVPIYHFYVNGKSNDNGMDLRSALRIYPESEYNWIKIKE